MDRRTHSIFLLVTFLLSLSLVVNGQQHSNRKLANRTSSYGFVSPNTREDLKLDQAIENLKSAEEIRRVQEVRDLACRVRATPRISKALGNWADGAENSMILRFNVDEPTIRYATAVLGRRWRQKTVLYFRRQVGGSARMYLISLRRSQRRFNFVAGTVAKTLDDAGVSYRTLVPLKTRVLVYVVDLSNELQPQVQKAAQQLRSRPLAFRGTGAFIGNDNDRDRAQAVFQQEIESYELNHSLNNRCHKIGPLPPRGSIQRPFTGPHGRLINSHGREGMGVQGRRILIHSLTDVAIHFRLIRLSNAMSLGLTRHLVLS